MHPSGRINTNPEDSHTVGILKEQFKNMEIMMELVKNRTLNLELCMQQQRSNSGKRPGMPIHPVDPYQYGKEWPMHGSQPHGVGLPLYGQPAMHGHGGTQVGLRYVPQGYMHPVIQHYYPVFPNVHIPQPVHGIHPVQVQGVQMQRQNPQGTSGIGIHNPQQTYAGPTLYPQSRLYGNEPIPQTRKTGQVDRENVGHMATSSNDGKTNMRDRQGVNESCMHRTTDMIAKCIDKHQKGMSVVSEGSSPSTPLVIEDDLTHNEVLVSNERMTSEVPGEQSVMEQDPLGPTLDSSSTRTRNPNFPKSDLFIPDQEHSKEKQEGKQSFLGNGKASTKKAIRRSLKKWVL